MDIIHYTKPVQFCIIRNYYKNDEVEVIHRELEKSRPFLKAAEGTGSAVSLDGQYKKNNKGAFVKENSIIHNLSRNLFGDLGKKLSETHWLYRYLDPSLTRDTVLVSVYESGGYYKTHVDMSILTAIYYTWKEPKSFDGGDFYFGDFKVPIENNCLLIFPGSTEHTVTQLNGGDRWAISQFINVIPTETDEKIITFPNFFHVVDYKRAQELTFKSDNWAFNGAANANFQRPTFWIKWLSEIKFFTEIIQDFLNENKMQIIRIYANGQTYGQDSDFHTDDDQPDHWTLLLYLNDISRDEIETWGGCTEFKTSRGIMKQFPIPNTAIMYKSDIWHRGMSPSRHVKDLRVTIAWKLKKIQ
jgi:predicted 2-oxoglutarate/Fe(II)-dependent dioxygenase YbiX